MAAEGSVIPYMITGVKNEYGRYHVPWNATHVSMHESVTVIPAFLFERHRNIFELVCHAGVKRIEREAFDSCPRLKRAIIPGVEVVEYAAFHGCEAVTDIECDKLERIGESAFARCKLSSINLPSAKVVEGHAFEGCEALTDVKFGKHLESIEEGAFFRCHSLERITIPLKNGLITTDAIFMECYKLKHVDLVEEAELRETIAAFAKDEWRNDMNSELDSIHPILLRTDPGAEEDGDIGGTARAIREWIERVLRKIVGYKVEHRRVLNEASSALQHALPNDIVMRSILAFLELPSHTFEGEDA